MKIIYFLLILPNACRWKKHSETSRPINPDAQIALKVWLYEKWLRGRIRTADLQVMSLTSYLTAPPRADCNF